VAKFALGLGLALQGHRIDSPDLLAAFYLMFAHLPGAWGEGEDRAKRVAVVERMTPALRAQVEAGAHVRLPIEVVAAARRTVLACMGLTSLLVFLLGARLVHPFTGLLASTLVCVHPAVMLSYHRAHSDIVALLFSAAAALAIFAFLRRLRQTPALSNRAVYGWAVVSGLLLALACAAKMNALVLVAVAGVATLAVIGRQARRDRPSAVRAALASAAIPGVALAAFIGINPSILADVRSGLAATVTEHRATEAIQSRMSKRTLTTLPAKFSAMSRLTVNYPVLMAALALAAAAALARAADGVRFIALWFLLSLAAVTFWLPLAQTRYALPVLLPTALFVSTLATVTTVGLWRRFFPSRKAA
jgi:4-amino-4-deoxy-L-arabinose transferase-like glycosyltransferase